MKTLAHHLNDRKTAIDSLLEQPRDKYNTETFHELRVEMKKLNALLDLIKFCYQDFKRKKTYKPFKKIFRGAGKVRELQVEESLLEKYFTDDPLIAYRKSLELFQSREEINFFLLLNKKTNKQLTKSFKAIARSLSNVNKKKAKDYLMKKGEIVAELLNQKTIPTQQIHELRKLLKTLNYNRETLSFTETNKLVLKKEVRAELLGQWHDLQVIINRLNNLEEIEDITSEEIILLERIKTEITSEREILFSEINLALPEY